MKEVMLKKRKEREKEGRRDGKEKEKGTEGRKIKEI